MMRYQLTTSIILASIFLNGCSSKVNVTKPIPTRASLESTNPSERAEAAGDLGKKHGASK